MSAVDIISKTNKEKIKTVDKKDSVGENEIITLNDQAKSNKSEILVLDQMIE